MQGWHYGKGLIYLTALYSVLFCYTSSDVWLQHLYASAFSLSMFLLLFYSPWVVGGGWGGETRDGHLTHVCGYRGATPTLYRTNKCLKWPTLCWTTPSICRAFRENCSISRRLYGWVATLRPCQHRTEYKVGNDISSISLIVSRWVPLIHSWLWANAGWSVRSF